MITTSRFYKIFLIYLTASIFSCVLGVLRPFLFGRTAYLFLIWNLFLAWIPFVLSGVLNHIYQNAKKRVCVYILLGLCGALWLAFFPNAPYMLTDFVHFSGRSFLNFSNGVIPFEAWYDFIMFSSFIITGLLIGFISLRIVHLIVKNMLGTVWGWVFAFVSLGLGSYAIYLGRFIRLNSWDIWHNTAKLLESVLNSFTSTNFLFIILLTMLLFVLYLMLVGIMNIGGEE